MSVQRTRRKRALMVACPRCKSPPGVACCGTKGPRKAMHVERMSASPSPSALKVLRAPVTAPDSFYTSDAWRMVRYDALRRSRGVCDCCAASPAPGRPLHVDHIKPRSRFPRLALDLSNLQVLCADCNIGKGARDQTDWRQPVTVQ